MCARPRSTRRCPSAARARRRAGLCPSQPAGARFSPQVYDAHKVNAWTDDVTQKAVDALVRRPRHVHRVPRRPLTLSLRRAQRNKSPNFKYMVSCLVLQKRGAGLHSATLATWDAQSDGSCTIQWCVHVCVALSSLVGERALSEWRAVSLAGRRENRSIICLLTAFATAI